MAFKHPPLPSDDAPFDDLDNPEWTAETFARAIPADQLPAEVLAGFPRTKKARATGCPDAEGAHVNPPGSGRACPTSRRWGRAGRPGSTRPCGRRWGELSVEHRDSCSTRFLGGLPPQP